MYVTLQPSAISASAGAWANAGDTNRGLVLTTGSLSGIVLAANGTAVLVSSAEVATTATLTATAYAQWATQSANIAMGRPVTITG